MINYQIIQVTPFYQNCSVLFANDSNEAVVVDPGGEVEKILKFLTSKQLECKQIWLTHSHLDHCGGVAELKQKTNATIYGHKIEKPLRENVETIKAHYGIFDPDMKNSPEPDIYIDEGDKLKLDSYEFQIFFTPGHSPGHLCFYNKESNLLLAGDTLFYDSIGRTDLPFGDYDQLISSIKDKLFKLPDDTTVISGHSEMTSIGREKKLNPFVKVV